MKVTQRTQVLPHEFEFSGKNVSGDRISITISGEIDVMIGDFHIHQPGLPVEKQKNYASKEELMELADMAIARFQALKESL